MMLMLRKVLMLLPALMALIARSPIGLRSLVGRGSVSGIAGSIRRFPIGRGSVSGIADGIRRSPIRRALARFPIGLLAGGILLFFVFSAGAAISSSISPEALLQSAKNDFQAGKFASASVKYEGLLARRLNYPQLREILLSFCESTLREGKLAKAESLTVFAKQKLSDPVALERIAFLRGEILYFGGDMERALKEYMDFLSANTGSPFANDVIDRLLLIDENNDNDGKPLAVYSRAEFLEFAGMSDSAVVAFRDLLKSFPNSQIADDAQMKMGDVLSSRGKFPEAIEEYRVLEARFPKSELVPVSKLKVAQLYSEKLREPDKAVAEYENTITAFPGTSFATEARSQLQKLKAGSASH
jgi:outer membrane protein assembly factor BamD (BamD/ComL family)